MSEQQILPKHEWQMVSDFLAARHGETLDAIGGMNRMMEMWGIKIDWHVFASVLDRMSTAETAYKVEISHRPKYYIH